MLTWNKELNTYARCQLSLKMPVIKKKIATLKFCKKNINNVKCTTRYIFIYLLCTYAYYNILQTTLLPSVCIYFIIRYVPILEIR